MRTRAKAILFLGLTAVPVMAPAQIAGRHDYGAVGRANPFLPDSRSPGPGIAREVSDLRARIDRGRESGALTGREARQLEREARLISRLAHRYGSDGLSEGERQELELRAQAVRAAASRPATSVRR